MQYWIILRKGKYGHVHHFDYFLPGLIPARILEMTLVSFVAEQFNLCENCELASHCHVIEEGTGKKYCPILFCDVVKPSWKVEQLI